jgi:transposase
MAPHCLGKPGDPGRRGRNNRLFVEAVLWIVRTGSPWRDLPPAFGNWSSAFATGCLETAVRRRNEAAN